MAKSNLMLVITLRGLARTVSSITVARVEIWVGKEAKVDLNLAAAIVMQVQSVEGLEVSSLKVNNKFLVCNRITKEIAAMGKMVRMDHNKVANKIMEAK